MEIQERRGKFVENESAAVEIDKWTLVSMLAMIIHIDVVSSAAVAQEGD